MDGSTGSKLAAPRTNGTIAVVVLTFDRLHLLRKCVERVLARTSAATSEIVVWDNNSADGTAEYLDSLDDPRITVVHHRENIGQNAYVEAFGRTTAEFLLELDDDIVDAPLNWDRTLLQAFERLPDVGFLAANLIDDPSDTTARIMYGRNAHLYTIAEVDGVRLKLGPVGGGCSITSRELYERAGGFRQRPGRSFWYEDAAYVADIAMLGYRAAYLESLRVHHTGGLRHTHPELPEQNVEVLDLIAGNVPDREIRRRLGLPRSELAERLHNLQVAVPDKLEFYSARRRSQLRKRVVKRALLGVPPVRALNERYAWFEPPVPVRELARG